MKQDTSTVVPRLRFPEFRQAPDWEKSTLSGVSKMRAGKFVAASDIADEPAVGWFPCYGGNGLRGYTKSFTHEGKYSLIGRQGALCGNVRLFDGAFHATEHALVVTPETDIDTDWLFYALGLLELNKYSIGQAQPGLSVQVLERVSIATPRDLAEQQKIADCLTSLDEVMAAQGRKVEALKAHKCGLMQQLFPREGETRPRLRFPEFRNAPEWKQKPAGALFRNRKEGGEAGLPIYSVTMNEGMIPRASFDRDFYDIEEPAKNKKAHAGDIAYNMMRMWQGAQGVAAENCMVSPAYVVLSPLGDVCSRFFAYFFKLPQSLELLTAHSRGLTKDRLRLYFDDFARMTLCVPGYGEQQRIADCLSSLDTRLAAESNQLAVHKTHKQGLMQQLFPAPEGAGA